LLKTPTVELPQDESFMGVVLDRLHVCRDTFEPQFWGNTFNFQSPTEWGHFVILLMTSFRSRLAPLYDSQSCSLRSDPVKPLPPLGVKRGSSRDARESHIPRLRANKREGEVLKGRWVGGILER
jgi:hypothetical protein